jgi:hypothetical protein
MMQESTSRKVVHYLVSTSLVLLAFAVQTGCSRCRNSSTTTSPPSSQGKAWMALDVRLVTSATFAFVLCLMKQVGDALSLQWLPWCHMFSGYNCQFDWLDLFLTVDGILTGLLLLIGLHMCSNRCYKAGVPEIPCDPTVAMSVDDGAPDDDDNDPTRTRDDLFDLTITDFDDDGGDDDGNDDDGSTDPYRDGVDFDLQALTSLAANDDEPPVLHATPTSRGRKDPEDFPEQGTMFTTLSSSPGSSPRRPLIYPSEAITV